MTSIPSSFSDPGGWISTGYYGFNGNPEVCYLEDELDDLDVSGSTNQSDEIIEVLEDIRGNFTSKVSGLTIDAEDSSCGYNKIVVGSADLAEGVLGLTTLVGYYPIPYSNDKEYAYTTVDFNTDTTWGLQNNQCGVNEDKDIEMTGNHEYGHALGLNHHGDVNHSHSIMVSGCFTTMDTIDDDTVTSLETRYGP